MEQQHPSAVAVASSLNKTIAREATFQGLEGRRAHAYSKDSMHIQHRSGSFQVHTHRMSNGIPSTEKVGRTFTTTL